MKTFSVLFLFFIFIFSEAIAGRMLPSSNITNAGDFHLFSDALHLKVSEKRQGDHFDVTILRPSPAGGICVRGYTSWFIFPESSTLLWFFDGASGVSRISLQPDGIYFRDSSAVPALISEAPKDFLQSLPRHLHPK